MRRELLAITGLILLTCSLAIAQTNELTGNCSPITTDLCTTKDTCQQNKGIWCITSATTGKCYSMPYTCICTIETPLYCTSQIECEKTQNYWCQTSTGALCTNTPCPSCTNTPSYCTSKDECTRNNYYWCYNQCTKTTDCTCTAAKGTCCNQNCNGTNVQTSDCQTCCIGECISNETICMNIGGYWCPSNANAQQSQCQKTPCTTCVQDPTLCTNKDECTINKWNWCYDTAKNTQYCTREQCLTTCSQTSLSSCTSNEICIKNNGFWCNNLCSNTPCTTCTTNPTYCTTYEECKNAQANWCYNNDKKTYYCSIEQCPTTCSQINTSVCTTSETCINAGGHWCYDKCINTTCQTVCAKEEGTCCKEGMNCNGTMAKTNDCSTCCLGQCFTCEGNNNCKTNTQCKCDNGYECNPASNKSLPNGCAPIIYTSIYTCGIGEDCLTNPACKCNPGDACKPGSELADDKGCVKQTNCTNCCGDSICQAGECEQCPNDCAFNECNGNQVCNLKIGENCMNSKDCPCYPSEECDPLSIYSRPRGCAPINKSICGNGIKEEGETSNNCCIDAGCNQGLCLASAKTANITFAKIYQNPKEYTCTLSYCGNKIIEPGETQDNCCIDTGCNEGECVRSDIDSFKCIKKTECGNGIKEGNENPINCCIDAGCPKGLTCTNNTCIKEAITQDVCASDEDCLCFKGCGAISKTYALTNPVCNENITCANTLPKCNQGKCIIELESTNDNQIIKYLSITKELRYRLEGLEPKILRLIEFLNQAYNYYINKGDNETASKFDNIANDTREFYLDYIELIKDTKDAINTPSQETVNYLSNRIKSVNSRLIEIITRINSLEINGVSVQELISGGTSS